MHGRVIFNEAFAPIPPYALTSKKICLCVQKSTSLNIEVITCVKLSLSLNQFVSDYLHLQRPAEHENRMGLLIKVRRGLGKITEVSFLPADHFYNKRIQNYASLNVNNGAGDLSKYLRRKTVLYRLSFTHPPPAPGMSLTGSFFTFVRMPRQHECIKRRQEARRGNVHVRLHPPGRWKKKPWQMLSGNPLARQRARIGTEIVEETKIKTEHGRGRGEGIDGSMEGFIAARTS